MWEEGKSDLDNCVETRSGKLNICWCVYLKDPCGAGGAMSVRNLEMPDLSRLLFV